MTALHSRNVGTTARLSRVLGMRLDLYIIPYKSNAMRTINFSDARSNLKDVLDRVVEDADVTIITRRDADDVVVMSLSEWNSWKETEYLLASPANARHLREVARGARCWPEASTASCIEPRSAPLRCSEPQAAYRAKTQTASAPSPRKRGKKRG